MTTNGPVTVTGAVRRYLDHLTVERGLAVHTLAAYRRDLLRYEATLAARGRTVIGDVTTDDVAAFLAGLREGDDDHSPLAASSAGRAVVAVRGLHAFAAAEGLASSDPASLVHPPVSPRKLPRAIGVPEVERLIAAAGGGVGGDADGDALRPLRDRALLELLYGTGARISEAVALDVDDLGFLAVAASAAPASAGRASAGRSSADRASAGPAEPGLAGQVLDDPVLAGPVLAGPQAPPATVRLAGKGGKDRVVPVGRYAREALEAYLVRARPTLAAAARRASASPAVFLNARGGRLTRQGAWGVLKAAADRAGLGGVSPHTLRHSYATHLLDGGADVRVVQELLGHASVTTTQIYTMVTVDKLREVYSAAHPRALG
ncbi:MAG TPA: site-specific tyrosine recombinase XerD [Streptosporangiaceae bacterium]|nr:site-specific tyrosine recombinase XerD [Streptosporangiaceae bacterium]